MDCLWKTRSIIQGRKSLELSFLAVFGSVESHCAVAEGVLVLSLQPSESTTLQTEYYTMDRTVISVVWVLWVAVPRDVSIVCIAGLCRKGGWGGVGPYAVRPNSDILLLGAGSHFRSCKLHIAPETCRPSLEVATCVTLGSGHFFTWLLWPMNSLIHF